jgi:hypothetical protein
MVAPFSVDMRSVSSHEAAESARQARQAKIIP